MAPAAGRGSAGKPFIRPSAEEWPGPGGPRLSVEPRGRLIADRLLDAYCLRLSRSLARSRFTSSRLSNSGASSTALVSSANAKSGLPAAA
jgi:hypothetical protein